MKKSSPFFFKGTQSAIYHIDRNEKVDNTVIPFSTGEWNIAAAQKYTDDYLHKYVLPYTGYQNCVARSAATYEFKDGSHQLAFEYAFVVNDIPVDNSGDTHGQEYFMLCPTLSISYSDKEEVCMIRVERCFETESPKLLSGSFVTVKSAARALEDYLAPEYKYEVNDIQIGYASVAVWNKSPYLYRPCWIFTINEKVGNVKMTDCLTAYVDMQDGHICIYDGIDGSRDDFSQYGV